MSRRRTQAGGGEGKGRQVRFRNGVEYSPLLNGDDEYDGAMTEMEEHEIAIYEPGVRA